MTIDADARREIVWRLGRVEKDVQKLDARVEKDVTKLDDEKADAKDIQILTQAFHDLRAETRMENESTRTTLKWFIGIYVVGLLGFAGIAIQIVSAG